MNAGVGTDPCGVSSIPERAPEQESWAKILNLTGRRDRGTELICSTRTMGMTAQVESRLERRENSFSSAGPAAPGARPPVNRS
jgi:hypothetical protein